MIDALLAALRATGIPFAYMAWSHSPDAVYGVVTVSGQTELATDEDSVSEKMLEGYVDVFTRISDGTEMTLVESCLRDLRLWFTFESVQYEEETGYIHYEWRWRDTNGNV